MKLVATGQVHLESGATISVVGGEGGIYTGTYTYYHAGLGGDGGMGYIRLEAVEDESGVVVLSKKKADRIRGWERVIRDHEVGDTVTGRAIRKIRRFDEMIQRVREESPLFHDLIR